MKQSDDKTIVVNVPNLKEKQVSNSIEIHAQFSKLLSEIDSSIHLETNSYKGSTWIANIWF